MSSGAPRWRVPPLSVTEVSPEDRDYGRSAILDATYYGCKAAIPRMIEEGGGSIVSISSVHGLLAARRSATYEAAKEPSFC